MKYENNVNKNGVAQGKDDLGKRTWQLFPPRLKVVIILMLRLFVDKRISYKWRYLSANIVLEK